MQFQHDLKAAITVKLLALRQRSFGSHTRQNVPWNRTRAIPVPQSRSFAAIKEARSPTASSAFSVR